jgi:adhesin transport system outer membrane protein
MKTKNRKPRFPLHGRHVVAGLTMIFALSGALAAEAVYRRCHKEEAKLASPVLWYYVGGSFKANEQEKMAAALAMLQPFGAEIVRSEKAASSERRILVGGAKDKESLRAKDAELQAAGLLSNWVLACEMRLESMATLESMAATAAIPQVPAQSASAPQRRAVESPSAEIDPRTPRPLMLPAALPTALPLTPVAQSAGLPLETLKDVVKRALESNPEVAVAEANRQVTAAEVDQAAANRLPLIDARLAAGLEQSLNASTVAAVGDSRLLNRTDAGLTLRQNLYDGGFISGEISRQKSRLESSLARLRESRESIAVKVADAYIEVVRNQELLQLAEDNLKAHQDIMVKTKDRYTSGASNKADYQLAEGRTALASATSVIRTGALQESRSKYRRVASSSPTRLAPPDFLGALPTSVEMASEMGMAGHPSVAVLRDELAAAKTAVVNARARKSPLVDLELGMNNNRDTGGVPGPSNNVSAMLVMHYNLFRGGADEAKIREAKARETAAAEALSNARRAIEEEVSKAWFSMVAAQDSQRFYQTHVQMTIAVLDSFRAQFDIGKRTMLDLMNSENELFQAKSNLISSQYNLLQAQYRLLAGMGGLLKTLGF